MAMERLLTVEDMAKISQLSESYFYTNKCLKKLDLPFIKFGRRSLRVRESDFLAWLEQKTERRG